MVEAQRMDFKKLAPEAYRHLIALEQTIAASMEPRLYHLIKLRASQINGCAFCIAMHTDEALRDGDSIERLVLLDAWKESLLYSEKERAALEWVEQITLIADGHAPKSAFDALRPHFADEEIAWLTLAATMINSWNRIAISARAQYHSAVQRTDESKVGEPA
jgi:AhpD family alkylhydroperoxidase